MNKLLGNSAKGLLFVISAPAGTGKTTLVRMLQDEFSCIVENVSVTTRAIRTNEIPGKDYHFISIEEFKKRIQAQEFLEYAEVFGNYYGTSKLQVEQLLAQGKHVILVIDTQGALQLKGKVEAVFIFISPPSLQALRERLFKRKTESEKSMEERLSWAQKEMSLSGHYDYHVINDRLDIAYDALRSILIAEEHRTHKEK